jgi:hypothetical protein
MISGCGPGGPTVVPVTGVALRGGKPVANLYLNFVPETGRPSWGVTDEAGRFKLNYTDDQDGAVVGKHKISAQFKPATAEAEFQMMAGKLQKPPELADILAKYGSLETTTKTVEITAETREIELTLD